MRWTRLELCDYICQLWAKTYNEETVDNKLAVIMGINYILEDLSTAKLPLLKKHAFINAIAEYATGTVTVATADGVSTVTGLLTVWTADMVGRKLIISGEKIAYTIKTVSAVGTLTLEEVYINTSDDTNTLATATAYTIVKDTYKLAKDFAIFADQEIYSLNSNYELTVRDSLEFDTEQPSRVTTGTPQDIVLRGLSEDTYYNTGTVVVNKGSASVAGTSTVWTAKMNGMPFRVVGDSAEYIFTYISAVSGSLDRVYEGVNVSGGTYMIDFPGLQLAELNPKPITPKLIKYFYHRMLSKLAYDSDVCPLPLQNAIIAGGIWRYSIVKEKTKLIEDNIFYQNYTIAKAELKNAGKVHVKNNGYRPRTY